MELGLFESLIWIMIITVAIAVYAPLLFLTWPVFCSYVSPAGRRIRKLINLVPGPPSLPIVGNALEFLVSREKVVEVRNRHFSSYSKIFKIWSFHHPLVKPVAPEYVEAILHSSKNIEKSLFYKLLHPWLGTGLLTSSGEKWFLHRKLLTPSFHFKILEDFIPMFIERSSSMIEKLSNQVKSGNAINVVPIISRSTLDMICESAMGIKLDHADKAQQDYISAIYTLGDIVYYRSMRPWFMIDLLFKLSKKAAIQDKALKILHQFTGRVIKEKKNKYIQKKSQRNEENESLPRKKRMKAFLDLLIELSVDNNLLSEEEIREEVDTFMFEGHDTTSMAISWMLLVLANHPEIQARKHFYAPKKFFFQEKIFKEVNDAWDKRISGSLEEGNESYVKFFNDMTYLDRCVKESLRLYPSVPVISRKLTEDLQMGEYLIPADTIIHIHVNNIHRNPLVYSDPDVFDPDRFLPEAVNTRHPYAYIPFSAGPRNCIGQRFAMLEIKTVISSIVQNFHLIAVDKPEDIVIVADLVLRAKDGIKIKFKPRKKCN
ncbi:hypothetical protein J437_LFUL010897 [Ladona fulva]|uniref:Cytochrome P450 n=1 Tax=Ladona fulva TaxID=123851 RepID=A0A8K0P506_LADFU|nr:hypothetical protein J437_LFUL010897 [Ladona fulva]